MKYRDEEAPERDHQGPPPLAVRVHGLEVSDRHLRDLQLPRRGRLVGGQARSLGAKAAARGMTRGQPLWPFLRRSPGAASAPTGRCARSARCWGGGCRATRSAIPDGEREAAAAKHGPAELVEERDVGSGVDVGVHAERSRPRSSRRRTSCRPRSPSRRSGCRRRGSRPPRCPRAPARPGDGCPCGACTRRRRTRTGTASTSVHRGVRHAAQVALDVAGASDAHEQLLVVARLGLEPELAEVAGLDHPFAEI